MWWASRLRLCLITKHTTRADKLISLHHTQTHFWESCWAFCSPSATLARRAVRNRAASGSSWWVEWWTPCRADWWLRQATAAAWRARKTQSSLSHVWTSPHRAIFPCAIRVCCVFGNWIEWENYSRWETLATQRYNGASEKISLNPCDNRFRSIKTTSCEARIIVSFEIEKKVFRREHNRRADLIRKQQREWSRCGGPQI